MMNNYPFKKEYGEVVSPGHPDKLADAIADRIVAAVFSQDTTALVGIEVAIALNRVFVTGRIASRLETGPDLDHIARDVYRAAGYGKIGTSVTWPPVPESIVVDESGLIRDEIKEDERGIRCLSDDQSITVGYALYSPETNYIPRAQWLAWQVMGEFRSLTIKKPELFGPDGKVLTEITNAKHDWNLDRLVVSMQHVPEIDWSELHRTAYRALNNLKARFKQTNVRCAVVPEAIDLIINGHGDFSTGGPMGDNGLSGKKLVMDAYGPMVPIGGGAYSGKDPHKVDRAGAVLAREIALHSVINRGNPWDIIQLAWAPGRSGYVSVNSNQGNGHGFERFPRTIDQCVKRYFQKNTCKALPEFACNGWYSGFMEAPWDRLVHQRNLASKNCPGA